ncbi:hypothetical protein N752_19415 [Desulforamulus aquiferis]|nr:hypothetical protein N752_19415 [Desulforamulus aquiferis]
MDGKLTGLSISSSSITLLVKSRTLPSDSMGFEHGYESDGKVLPDLRLQGPPEVHVE